MTSDETPTGSGGERDYVAADNLVAAFASIEDARAAISALERHGVAAANIALLEYPAGETGAGDVQTFRAGEVRGLRREIEEGQVLVGVHSDDPATVDRAEEILRGTQLVYVDRFQGRQRVGAERHASSDTVERGTEQGAAPPPAPTRCG